MEHADHVELLRDGVPGAGGMWADFGAGRGAFTLALAELIGPQGQIFAIDTDRRALEENARAFQRHFGDEPSSKIEYIAADFARSLSLPPLDGVVMANSLHFQREKEPVLTRIKDGLKPGGRLVLVEYNVDRGNLWVPFPLSYTAWESLARRAGFSQVRLLRRRRSSFLNEIYSSLAIKENTQEACGPA